MYDIVCLKIHVLLIIIKKYAMDTYIIVYNEPVYIYISATKGDIKSTKEQTHNISLNLINRKENIYQGKNQVILQPYLYICKGPS